MSLALLAVRTMFARPAVAAAWLAGYVVIGAPGGQRFLRYRLGGAAIL